MRADGGTVERPALQCSLVLAEVVSPGAPITTLIVGGGDGVITVRLVKR